MNAGGRGGFDDLHAAIDGSAGAHEHGAGAQGLDAAFDDGGVPEVDEGGSLRLDVAVDGRSVGDDAGVRADQEVALDDGVDQDGGGTCGNDRVVLDDASFDGAAEDHVGGGGACEEASQKTGREARAGEEVWKHDRRL